MLERTGGARNGQWQTLLGVEIATQFPSSENATYHTLSVHKGFAAAHGEVVGSSDVELLGYIIDRYGAISISVVRILKCPRATESALQLAAASADNSCPAEMNGIYRFHACSTHGPVIHLLGERISNDEVQPVRSPFFDLQVHSIVSSPTLERAARRNCGEERVRLQ